MRKYFFILFLITSFHCFAAQDDGLDLIISSDQIRDRITEIGQQISKDYEGKDLTVVVVMKGGISVTADLMRAIDVPFKLESISVSSYGYNGTKRGELKVKGLKNLEVEARDVLIVDDIFDSGSTMIKAKEEIESKNPRSVKTLSLLVKDIPRATSYLPDYVLFHIPDLFVIGYGLDYKELYRGLPAIYAFPNNVASF